MSRLNEDLDLKYLIKMPKRETSEKPLFIFLHGFGSNEMDLFSLSEELPENFTVISTRSPYTLGPGSYSFYDIDYSTGTKIINLEQAYHEFNGGHEIPEIILNKFNYWINKQ